MCDALMELFADKLDARERQGMQQGMQKGVLLKRIEKTRKKFDKGLSAAEAADCLEEDENVMETLY